MMDWIAATGGRQEVGHRRMPEPAQELVVPGRKHAERWAYQVPRAVPARIGPDEDQTVGRDGLLERLQESQPSFRIAGRPVQPLQ